MNSSKVRYRLSPNEEAGILQQERERRRKLRIQQVREQERAFAKHIRDQVELKKQQELKVLAMQLKDDWMIAKEEERQALTDLYQKTLDAVGGAHLSAETQPPYDKIREETKVENDKKAKERGQKAFQRQQEEDEKRLQEEFALVMARKTALEIERARAALIAKKPSRKSDLNDAEVTKEPTRVLHQDGFSTTHYTIPTEYAEKADPEEQGDAKQAAREEEKRMKEEMREKKQELEERKTKASLRQRHAQEKEQLEKDLNYLLEELGQMEQADRRRRQLVVSNIPKQIFVPPHRRLEEKEENQKDLEQAFENMYMAKTDYAGDIELALEPALPQVEADLDLSSDISEEHFKIPEKAEPKRFPQGLDEVKKMSPTGKRDTLRKLLLKVQSQKHDHKLRKKTEISQQIVDGLPQELSTPSKVTESVSSSGITPSSITTESTITKTSSSTQTSSKLSQHPLSSSEMESRLPSSVSGSLETGPISDESSSNGKSTLMHPLEAAYRLRKKEKDEENMKMGNHERDNQEQKYEEFHPLSEQTTFPEKMLDNMREIQPQNGHPQDQNLIYQEEQKYGSESVVTQSLEESPESLDESKEEMKGQSIALDVPASRGYRKYKEDDTHSSGTADFQPLEPSHMNSLSPEPHGNLAMGTSGVGRLHEGHNMVDIPSQREDVISGRGRGDKRQRPDEDISGRYSGSLSKESVQQTDVRASVVEAPSQIPKKQVTSIKSGGYQGIHSSTRQRVAQGGMPTKCDELHSNQLIRDLSPSQLESVRRAYPNIYEAVTGKNRNEVDSDVQSVEGTSHQMATATRMTGGDVRMDSEILDMNRKLSSTKMTSFGERDGTGSKVARPEVGSLEGKMKKTSLEVGTGDVDKGIATEGEISEKSSDELIDPTEGFRSSLHDYQEQLLKLQRTNELQLLEAQAQLQQRRQRLMDLYPQIQLPAYKPYIPAGHREVLRKEEERGGSGKEDEEENEKRSRRMDSTVSDTTGRMMDHRNMSAAKETHTVTSHHTAGQGRELGTDNKGNYFEETFQNTDNFREIYSGLQGGYLGTAQGGITESAFVRPSQSIHMGGRTQPLQDELRGSKMSDQGPVHLQSFSTPPLHFEVSPSASGYGATNFQFQSPQMGDRRLNEAQNEPSRQQMYPQESWGTPHVHREEIGQAIESYGISQAHLQDKMPEVREMQSKGSSEHIRNISFTKEEPMPKKSPHGVWRPVKELRVSLPSVEMLEQSPLTTENTSLFSQQGSSFTKTPTTESHGPSCGPAPLDHDSKQGEGQQVLLTPRKLAQLDKASSFNLPVDQSSHHAEPKVNRVSLSQEALSPRKLITPNMLVGERVEARRTLDTHLHEETNIDTSCEDTADEYMDQTGEYYADQDIPQYREENKMTSYQEIPTDDFVKRLESQRHFQKFESFKRDFYFRGMNQTSKSSPDLILPENDARGLPKSQTMSAISLQSQSESSLDMGMFSKRERVGGFYNQGRLSSEDDSVVLNRKKETMNQGSFGMGQVRTSFGQNSTGFNQHLTHYDQIQTGYDQIPTSFGQVHANKFSDDEKDLKGSSKDPLTPAKDISGSSHIIEHGNDTTKDHGNTNLEEPTDRGLLEALKNLMLAKARSKVPGAATGTTNYFTHLDLTSSGSEKTKPLQDKNEGLKSTDAPSEVLFEAVKETDSTEEDGVERSAEEVKVPMVRHRIHHKPPVANQSKLLALEEMAPHELSTIIEVETPVFENLPTFPFPEDIEKEAQRSQNGAHRSFDEGVTSSSDWGTPHHHTPGSSQGSGSNQSQEIYIHQPMVMTSVEELEREEEVTLTGEKNGRDDVMDEQWSKGDLSITSQTSMKEPLMMSSVSSMSSEIGVIRKTVSKDFNVSSLLVKISSHDENLDDMTLSEGPISTSSENSFNIQQVTEQGNDASGPVEQDLTSNQLFPLSSEVLKMRSPGHMGSDQKLATFGDKAGFQYQRGMERSSISNHGATSISDAGLDYKDSKGEGRSVQSFIGVTIEPENGDLTLEEGPLQETLTEDREFSASHQHGEVDVTHPDPRMSLHYPDKATVMGHLEERSLQSSEGSHQAFFEDLMGQDIQQSERGEEDLSRGPSSYSEGTILEQATSEAGIMEEPELTFQTTFDTNFTLDSVQEVQPDEITSNPSDSLLSFIRHEEQFAHSTPLKVPTHGSPQKVQPSPGLNQETLNQGPKEPSEPLTLQDALARHKASFIKASQARQKEVKVHAGTKSQAGTAFALTIKNWQKAKLEAQQKNRTKGMKKQTDRNKENVEIRSKVAPKAKTSQDRKAAFKADKERTKRLYNQLEEVRQRKIQSERQKSYAENRQKRKEYEEKMKQRRLQQKNQLQKT
ncbi:hypothetical protein HOLleu_27371 [Holothuria leucospilota]|uniref:ALMS motif domain-containing protein n=1 Tax=Holothuria leucospilota TaxID=206669 RepID=A0A9Q1H298_HOLLE|nr:hypothetical protein HOLleu_27371 [Holothuria leucospilota]